MKAESDRAKADASMMDRVMGLSSAEQEQAKSSGGQRAAVKSLPLPGDVPRGALEQLHTSAKSNQSLRVKASDFVGGPSRPVDGYQQGVYRDGRRLAELFSQETTENPSVRIYRSKKLAEADTVGEGAEKPDAGLEIESVDVDIRKVAVTTKLSDEAISDFDGFQDYVADELTGAVRHRENKLMLDALEDADLETASDHGGDGVDAVADAIAELSGEGVEPDAVAMSPKRLAKIRKAKAEDAGSYLVANPTDDGPSKLHGLSVTTVPKMSDDKVYVGAFAKAGTLYVREDLSMDVGLSGEDFTHNLKTLRAEERLALGITSPKRIIEVDLSDESD